eukprot:807323-Pelagomonas_calceolata.AAC.6
MCGKAAYAYSLSLLALGYTQLVPHPHFLACIQVCEVEVEKFSTVPGPDGSSGGKDLKGSGRSVIRSCIAKIPPGYARVDITQMTDQIWGVDGFDT